jgi:TRIAD3 protein (E3 ubiquitin-protein ligase RNF216)
MLYIDEILNQEGHRLFTTYLALEKAQRTYNPHQPAYIKLKSGRKINDEFSDAKLEGQLIITDDEARKEVLRELQAVRKTKQKDDAERQAKHSAALEEEENVRRAVAEGTMLECGCCCDDFPFNRMVHCDNENPEKTHWFCKGCALKSAEEEAGSGKYELFCMSMDKCTAGFSRDQRYFISYRFTIFTNINRAIFLTESIIKVLEGNEQETNLRLAGIMNLARCYACSSAAECPTIELDFEFRCPNPDCREVTCRRCQEQSHTPMTCEEAKKNKGLELHHLVAESMSEGVIRKCNKCTSPFIKEEGCNKMTCTRCGNIQCYVCSKNCGYDHFNDTTRGGKQGNCPLFDNSDERHVNDRNKAKQERIAAIRAEHPEYTEEDLDIKMSEEVAKDDEKRRLNNPRARLAHLEARMGEQVRARAIAVGGGGQYQYQGQ